MSMNPDPQGQRPGLFGRIGNFFGAGDPNAGQATDPFANLSRAQRTMLGFAALRDAAASLEGRDSNYFAQAMGGFESARERERLREQGEFANRNQQMMNLIQMQALARAVGDPTLEQFASDQLATIMGGAGGVAPAAGGAVPPMQPPGDFTGGVVPQGLPSGPQGVTGAPQTGVVYDSAGTVQPQPYTGEPEVVQTGGVPAAPVTQPAAPTDPIAAIDAELANIEGQIEAIIQGQPTGADVTVGAIAGIPVGEDPQAQARLARLQEQEARLLARREAAVEAQTAEQLAQQQAQTAAEISTPQTANVLQTVQDLRSIVEESPRLTTGAIGSVLARVPGSAAYDARALTETIAANLGFGELQAMREASPTGGALGAVSERELTALQSTVANLDLGQSPEQIMRNLEIIENRYQALIRRAYETSEDPAALDRALGGRPSFMVEGGGGEDGWPTVTMPDGTQVRIRVRD